MMHDRCQQGLTYDRWFEKVGGLGTLSLYDFGELVATAVLNHVITSTTDKYVPPKKLMKIKIHSCKQCCDLMGILRPCTSSFRNLDDKWIDPECPLTDLPQVEKQDHETSLKKEKR